MSTLADGLLDARGAPLDLSDAVRVTAKQLMDASVDAGFMDALAELLARWAEVLSAETVDSATFREAVAHLGLPEPVLAAVLPAFVRPLGRAEIAALAIHVVDISEAIALALFMPELPSISAKADRTGGAARSVGVAKRLRG